MVGFRILKAVRLGIITFVMEVPPESWLTTEDTENGSRVSFTFFSTSNDFATIDDLLPK